MNNHEDLVSVLMPTYNVEKYISEAVESILNQSYENLELIIVDDHSSDKTFELLKGYAKKDSRIKLFRNNKNLKICKTLNKAWKESKGNYIVRMDGDDISEKNRIEVMIDFMKKNNNIDLVGTYTNSIDENGIILGKKKYLKKDNNIKKYMKYGPQIVHIWMSKRSVYEKLNGYREIPYVEDFDFLVRGMKYGFKYANIDRYLYSIRTRNGNTNSSNGLMQKKAYEYEVYLLRKESMKFDLFNVDVYNKKIASTNKEKKQFIKSANYLNSAVRNKNNKLMCITLVLRAMFTSKYNFKYIIHSLIVRVAIVCEEKIKCNY